MVVIACLFVSNKRKNGLTVRDQIFCATSHGPTQSPKLRQGTVMKTSFETRVSRMGLCSFMDINSFVMTYIILFSFLIFTIFFKSLETKSTKGLDPKRKFGSFVQRYCLKFRTQRRFLGVQNI